MVRTSDPVRYWVGVRLPSPDLARPRGQPLVLLLVSDSLTAGGLFLDWKPWVVLAGGALLFSVLFWLPLVHRITRTVSQMTRVTGRIAEGDFEARVGTWRRDELGELATAINRMAARLDGFVRGQKRFLGDVAHELCSPLARVQVALGVLEQRADERQRAHLDDLREEVQEISALVNELLSFSRAGLKGPAPALRPVVLADLVCRAAEREAEAVGLSVRVDPDLRVLAEPDLLLRALANLLRNAVRYAGQAGLIEISATAVGDRVRVVVADRGPGVPEAELARIFDPFYRVEASRSREGGGAGLGLAIVRTCVEACAGKVVARNRSPAGLEVEMELGRSAGP
jgi:two-component system sensor histidine kinase CpxA